MVLTAKNPKRVRLFKTTPSVIPITAKPAEMKNPSVAANRYFAINDAMRTGARADARSTMRQNRNLLTPEATALPAKSVDRMRRSTPPESNAICTSFPNHVHAGDSHQHQEKRDARGF